MAATAFHAVVFLLIAIGVAMVRGAVELATPGGMMPCSTVADGAAITLTLDSAATGIAFCGCTWTDANITINVTDQTHVDVLISRTHMTGGSLQIVVSGSATGLQLVLEHAHLIDVVHGGSVFALGKESTTLDDVTLTTISSAINATSSALSLHSVRALSNATIDVLSSQFHVGTDGTSCVADPCVSASATLIAPEVSNASVLIQEGSIVNATLSGVASPPTTVQTGAGAILARNGSHLVANDIFFTVAPSGTRVSATATSLFDGNLPATAATAALGIAVVSSDQSGDIAEVIVNRLVISTLVESSETPTTWPSSVNATGGTAVAALGVASFAIYSGIVDVSNSMMMLNGSTPKQGEPAPAISVSAHSTSVGAAAAAFGISGTTYKFDSDYSSNLVDAPGATFLVRGNVSISIEADKNYNALSAIGVSGYSMGDKFSNGTVLAPDLVINVDGHLKLSALCTSAAAVAAVGAAGLGRTRVSGSKVTGHGTLGAKNSIIVVDGSVHGQVSTGGGGGVALAAIGIAGLASSGKTSGSVLAQNTIITLRGGESNITVDCDDTCATATMGVVAVTGTLDDGSSVLIATNATIAVWGTTTVSATTGQSSGVSVMGISGQCKNKEGDNTIEATEAVIAVSGVTNVTVSSGWRWGSAVVAVGIGGNSYCSTNGNMRSTCNIKVRSPRAAVAVWGNVTVSSYSVSASAIVAIGVASNVYGQGTTSCDLANNVDVKSMVISMWGNVTTSSLCSNDGSRCALVSLGVSGNTYCYGGFTGERAVGSTMIHAENVSVTGNGHLSAFTRAAMSNSGAASLGVVSNTHSSEQEGTSSTGSSRSTVDADGAIIAFFGDASISSLSEGSRCGAVSIGIGSHAHADLANDTAVSVVVARNAVLGVSGDISIETAGLQGVAATLGFSSVAVSENAVAMSRVNASDTIIAAWGTLRADTDGGRSGAATMGVISFADGGTQESSCIDAASSVVVALSTDILLRTIVTSSTSIGATMGVATNPLCTESGFANDLALGALVFCGHVDNLTTAGTTKAELQTEPTAGVLNTSCRPVLDPSVIAGRLAPFGSGDSFVVGKLGHVAWPTEPLSANKYHGPPDLNSSGLACATPTLPMTKTLSLSQPPTPSSVGSTSPSLGATRSGSSTNSQASTASRSVLFGPASGSSTPGNDPTQSLSTTADAYRTPTAPNQPELQRTQTQTAAATHTVEPPDPQRCIDIAQWTTTTTTVDGAALVSDVVQLAFEVPSSLRAALDLDASRVEPTSYSLVLNKPATTQQTSSPTGLSNYAAADGVLNIESTLSIIEGVNGKLERLLLTIEPIDKYWNVGGAEIMRVVLKTTAGATPVCGGSQTFPLTVGIIRVNPQQDALAEGVRVTVAAAGAVTQTASVVTGSDAGDVTSVAMLSLMSCAKPEQRASGGNSRLLSPVPFSDESSGMIAGNLVLVAAITLLHWVAKTVLGWKTRRKGGADVGEVREKLRWPSYTIGAAALLNNGTLFFCLRALRKGAEPGAHTTAALGLFFWLVVVGLTVLVAAFVATAKYHEYNHPTAVRQWLLPFGQWRGIDSRRRFGTVLNAYRMQSPFWVLRGFVSPTIIAIGAAPQPQDEFGCALQYGFLAAFQLIYTGVIAFFRPFRSPVVNVLSIASGLCVAIIALTSAIATDPSASRGAGTAGSIATLLQSLCSAGLSCYSAAMLFENRITGETPTTEKFDRIPLRLPGALATLLADSSSLDTPLLGRGSIPRGINMLPSSALSREDGTELTTVVASHDESDDARLSGSLDISDIDTSLLPADTAKRRNSDPLWSMLDEEIL